MINFGGLVTFRPHIVNEAEDDKYTHIGYGKYKKKGKEKDTNAPTFTKDDAGKYVASGKDDSKGGEKADTEKPKVNIFDKPEKSKESKPKSSDDSTDTTDVDTVPSSKLKDLMPQSDDKAFGGNSDIDNIPADKKREISMKLDKLADLTNKARAAGKNPPNFNLCDITIPGTNLYCNDNLGIPREEMPQFKGKPQPGSTASKLPADKSGEVDTEPMFKSMLEKNGIKTVQTEIPSDLLKATQTELVGSKVVGMAGALEKDPNNPGITAPIYVSRDGYVIDGHHRWAAITSYAIKHNKPTNMKVIVLDMDSKDIIPMANKFAQDIGVASKKADSTDSPTKDSPKPRAGNPSVNKAVRTMAKKHGITPQKLGKEEYQKNMIQATTSALIDSNFPELARELVAGLENKPEWAKKVDYDSAGSMADPDYRKKADALTANSAYASEYMKPSDDVEKFGINISKASSWDSVDIIDSIAFDLKMNGSHKLAQRIQSLIENKQTMKLKDLINEDGIVNKEISYYTGTRESAVAEFIKTNNLDGEALVKFIRKGNKNARRDFISALVGKPGNKIQKLIIKKFGK